MLGLRGFAGLNSTNKYQWNSHTIKGNVGKRVIYMVCNCIDGANARIGLVLKSVKYGNRSGWFLVFLTSAGDVCYPGLQQLCVYCEWTDSA